MSARGPSREVPFVGLRPFDTTDAAWFFGRDRETAALTRKLRASRFTAVVGTSGSGKSSVVRAGVVPLLENDGWQQIVTTPGSAPLDRLARKLAGVKAEDRLGEARRFRFNSILRASAFGLTEIAEVLRVDASRLLLVVDQFEELFRYGDEATGVLRAAMREEARAFVELLLTATRATTGRLQVCATMRSDYFGACSAYVGLAEAVSASQFLIPQMQREQLGDAIRKPVAQAGAVIEEGFVQRLLVDVVEEHDQLPLLQHTLRRLWEQASGEPRTMREVDYVAVGKIAGSIDTKAEAVMDALSKANPTDVATLECVMKALTELDERGRATRRLQKRSELFALVSGRPATTPAVAMAASLDRVLAALQAEDRAFTDKRRRRSGRGHRPRGADPWLDPPFGTASRLWQRLAARRAGRRGAVARLCKTRGGRGCPRLRRMQCPVGQATHRVFGNVWSERYGDGWAEIQSSRNRSADKIKQQQVVKAWAGFGMTVLLVTLFWLVYSYNRQRVVASEQAIIAYQQATIADETFRLAVTSTKSYWINLAKVLITVRLPSKVQKRCSRRQGRLSRSSMTSKAVQRPTSCS